MSRVNSIEEGKPGLRNETEQRGRVESTLTSLHQRITDLEKGSKVKRRDYARGAIEDFFFFFSLWRYQITVREGNGRKKKPYSVRIQFGIVSLYDPDLMFYSSSQSWSSPPHRAVSCSNSCRLNHFEHALNDPSLRLLPEPSEKLKQEGKKKQKQTHCALWVCPPPQRERERERERKERKLQICVEEGTNTRLTTPLLL